MEIKNLIESVVRKRVGEVINTFGNPNEKNHLFINDRYDADNSKLEELKKWYSGDSNELLEYYTEQIVTGFYNNPIYNRNRLNYFWAIASREQNIKRVHSGIPHSIITTLTRIVGVPTIKSDDELVQKRIEEIIDNNDLMDTITQEQMPLTLVEGYGAYKIDFNKALSDTAIITYYEAKDVEFIYKQGILLGIIYKTFYNYDKEDYLLLEIRSKDKTSSKIEYSLYRLGKNNNELFETEMSSVPEFKNYEGVELENFPYIMGVPSMFYKSVKKKGYGRSILDNKIDLFDELDQALSQAGRTTRLSTPAEYVPRDLMDQDSEGNVFFPESYDRRYLAYKSTADGDGNTRGQIIVTQPNLNIDQYTLAEKQLLDNILTGILSPATLGIDVSARDNGLAQREKEKITIYTRNEIAKKQEKIIKKVLNLALYMQTFIETGKAQVEDVDINVAYNEFANPSFETILPLLSSAWSIGSISTERYVELLWGDKISEEEKLEEIEKLNNRRDNEQLEMGDFEDERTARESNREQESEEEEPIESKE
jgi:hypothetical protein